MTIIKESTEDILRKMRSMKSTTLHGKMWVNTIHSLADRIEAAHKREIEDAIAATVVAAVKSAAEVYEPLIKSDPVGNAAKMREALDHWNYLCPHLEELYSASNKALEGYKNEFPKEVSGIIEEDRAALFRAKGEAIWELGAEHEYAYCSHCGHQQWASWDSYREAYENIGEFHKEYKFCPNCGFEMKGANNEQ